MKQNHSNFDSMTPNHTMTHCLSYGKDSSNMESIDGNSCGQLALQDINEDENYNK
jgi:hypothetical protein